MYLLDRFVLFLHVFEMLQQKNTINPRGASQKECIQFTYQSLVFSLCLSPLSSSPLVLCLRLCGVVLGRVQRLNEAVLMGQVPQVLKLQQSTVDAHSKVPN